MLLPDPVLDKVREIASDLFDVPVSQVTQESTPATLKDWDSVQQLNLMLALEEEFQVKFEPEDLEHFQSIGQVAAQVRHKLAR